MKLTGEIEFVEVLAMANITYPSLLDLWISILTLKCTLFVDVC